MYYINDMGGTVQPSRSEGGMAQQTFILTPDIGCDLSICLVAAHALLDGDESLAGRIARDALDTQISILQRLGAGLTRKPPTEDIEVPMALSSDMLRVLAQTGAVEIDRKAREYLASCEAGPAPAVQMLEHAREDVARARKLVTMMGAFEV